MHGIEIDFEVYKALTNLRESEKITYNDVIRQLLKLPSRNAIAQQNSQNVETKLSGWMAKKVTFPDGTEFRASYNGQIFYANIRGRSLILNGKKTSSLSQAARLVSGTNVNGWTFWQCKFPGETKWRLSQSLREL
jgi:predicted CopG family antitoxin